MSTFLQELVCILGKLARLGNVWGRVAREFPDGSCGGKFRKNRETDPKRALLSLQQNKFTQGFALAHQPGDGGSVHVGEESGVPHA